MNDAHLHLLVNHVPVLGTAFALLLGVYALVRRLPDVLRVALGVLVICGVGSFTATQTGARAEAEPFRAWLVAHLEAAD